MSLAVKHAEPWTVDDLFALPDDGMRHELVDGVLLVTPPPGVTHQRVAGRIRDVLARAAPADLEVLEGVGFTVLSGLLVPDVAVARRSAVDAGGRDLAAEDVLAVVEVVSPWSKRRDRSWKPELYAEAGIATYWRVESPATGPVVFVHRLEDGGYVEVARLDAGRPGTAPLPYPVTFDPAALVSRS